MLLDREIKNILVIKLRTLGDILTTFPLLRALKELYPGARLTFIADDVYQDLFTCHPRVDQFWAHPAGQLRARGAWFELKHMQKVSRAIAEQGIDLCLDLYGSARTALWGALARVPVRLGFNLRGRKYFYTQRITAQHDYVVDLNLQFAEALGWKGTDRSLEFFLSEADTRAAEEYLKAQGWDPVKPALQVSPGGGWALKKWDSERFGQVAGRIVQATGCQVFISGLKSEQTLITACGQALGRAYIPVIGLPLRQLAAVIKKSRLFLGNDSGPKYFAEAFGIPTLICYGPTDFINNNPNSPKNLVAYQEIECRPCHAEECQNTRRACLDDLSVETVFSLAMRLWGRG